MKAQNPYVNCWILGQTTSWSLQPSAERIITPSGISQGPAGATRYPEDQKWLASFRPGKAWNSQAAETPGDPGRTVGACHWENNEKPLGFWTFSNDTPEVSRAQSLQGLSSSVFQGRYSEGSSFLASSHGTRQGRGVENVRPYQKI